jgi:hypothetical protein
MRGLPGDYRQRSDDQCRHQPDHDLDLGRVRPVGRIVGRQVRRAVAPRERDRQDDHGDHHDQHEQRRPGKGGKILDADAALRIEQIPGAAAQRCHRCQPCQPATKPAQSPFVHVHYLQEVLIGRTMRGCTRPGGPEALATYGQATMARQACGCRRGSGALVPWRAPWPHFPRNSI